MEYTLTAYILKLHVGTDVQKSSASQTSVREYCNLLSVPLCLNLEPEP